MKFGKRLLGEASRRWSHSYIDYKQLKNAIKQDVAAADPRGLGFEQALRLELRKVAAFYVETEEELAAAMSGLSHASGLQEVAALRGELQDLRKFVALNYIAVVKATKKRNRHLRVACGEGGRVVSLRAVHILSQQYFFTSPKLAALSTQAEILSKELAPSQRPVSEVLQEYQCPICLGQLRSPVLLTCAHRFCWGCLLAHCTAVQSSITSGGGRSDGKDGKQQAAEQPQVAEVALIGSSSHTQTAQQQQETQQQAQLEQQRQPVSPASVLIPAVWEAESSDDEQQAAVCTFDCAVCRKAQILNLDRLQVDPHLDAFLQRLASQQQRNSSSLPIPCGGASQAAAAEMVSDSRPPSGKKAASLAEVSEQLAEAAEQLAAPAGAAATAAQQQQPLQAAAAAGPEVVLQVPAGLLLGAPALLPPQRAEHQGRLVVCLDLDGTLVTTFTPKRAPLLPAGSVSYIVGRGGKLNPGGVFVVERPGLGEFLRRIAPFAEVVLFTAGLQDYAEPICDAIESRYPGCFHHRLYRPATVASEVYPCIKDMSLLGRDLHRCVLVDDTPLAFFRQPDHGIPVLQFRGDIDDRMLPEAVAPLLEGLHASGDVAAQLARRFNMTKWFLAQGLAPPAPAGSTADLMHRTPSLPQLKLQPLPGSSACRHAAPAVPAVDAASQLLSDASAAEVMGHGASSNTLLVCDFDKTLVDWDAGERLCDELAPELTSLLSTIQMPANFVPVTNTVLAEMHRRGVSRDRLVGCLREMGREVPLPTVRMLQWAARRGLETMILSDCNSVFIGHILTGARVSPCIRHVITNQAAFHRVPAAVAAAAGGEEEEQEATEAAAASPAGDSAAAAADKPASGSRWGFFRSSPSPSSSATSSSSGGSSSSSSATTVVGGGGKLAMSGMQRLVIQPRHNHAACGSHGCSICPANLCKGAELATVRSCAPYCHRRIVYCGDGANDLCPALGLGPQDVVLARGGHALERLIAERAVAPEGSVRRVVAAVHVWHTHEQLYRLVQQHAA